MREIVHLQAGQCGNQIGAKVIFLSVFNLFRVQPFSTFFNIMLVCQKVDFQVLECLE